MNILLDTTLNSQTKKNQAATLYRTLKKQRLRPCTTPTNRATAFYKTLTKKATTLSTL